MNSGIVKLAVLLYYIHVMQCMSLPPPNVIDSQDSNSDMQKYIVRMKPNVNINDHKQWLEKEIRHYKSSSQFQKRDSSSNPSINSVVQMGNSSTDKHASTMYIATLPKQLANTVSRHPNVSDVEPNRVIRHNTIDVVIDSNFGTQIGDENGDDELRKDLQAYGDQTGSSTEDYTYATFSQAGGDLVAELNPPNWGLDRIDQRSSKPDMKYYFEEPSTSSPVNVYVIDSGIMTNHIEFKEGNAVMLFCNEGIFGINNCGDNMGHGSHTSGIIGGYTVGVSKGIQLYGVKAIDTGNTTSEAVINALTAISDHMKNNPNAKCVVNMSFGGTESDLLNSSVEHLALDHDCVVVVAAGNSHIDACTISPASSQHVLTVGSINSRTVVETTSNYGNCVGIYAPGKLIKSVGISGTDAYKIMSGTSMAAPHVAGVAANYRRQHPNANQEQVRKAIVDGATRVYTSDQQSTSSTIWTLLNPFKWKEYFNKPSFKLLYSRI